MALYKRGKTWHTDFSVNGQRYRQSLETTDWRQAESREKELIGQGTARKIAPSSQQFSRLSFNEAADSYVADRLAHLAPRSISTERERLKPLRKILAALRLTRISGETVRAYIANRKEQGAANRTVNMELGILRQILKRAKRWHLLADDVRSLPERRHDGPCALTRGKSGTAQDRRQ